MGGGVEDDGWEDGGEAMDEVGYTIYTFCASTLSGRGVVACVDLPFIHIHMASV
jgi:hypothetical protein